MPLPDLASQLAHDHRDALYAFALTLSGDPAEASDLVQDTFERALRRLERLRPDTNARAWLCTILHHLFVDKWRSKAARPTHDPLDDHALTLAGPELEPPPAWADVGHDEIWGCVGRLEPALRQVYELFAADGLSYQQIATRLELPMNTVGTRLLRARKKLRECLSSHRKEDGR